MYNPNLQVTTQGWECENSRGQIHVFHSILVPTINSFNNNVGSCLDLFCLRFSTKKHQHSFLLKQHQPTSDSFYPFICNYKIVDIIKHEVRRFLDGCCYSSRTATLILILLVLFNLTNMIWTFWPNTKCEQLKIINLPLFTATTFPLLCDIFDVRVAIFVSWKFCDEWRDVNLGHV